MDTFKLLHLRRFREHPGRTLLSLMGIAIGGALVVAVLGFFGSLNGSVEAFTSDIAGAADIEVAAISDDGMQETLFFEIEKTEGVETAVPMIRSTAVVNDKRALVVGLDQRAEKLGTGISRGEAAELREQAPQPGVFIGEPLAEILGLGEGDTVDIVSGSHHETMPIISVLGGEAATLNQGKFVGAFLPLAQRITGKIGKLDAVLVVAEPQADPGELRLALGRAVGNSAAVQSLEQRAEQARIAMRNIQTSMLMGVGMALVVGAFLIFNTMNMAATERRRELATLRALGGRRRPLMVAFLFEAAVLGLVGSALGALLGLFVARLLVDSIPPFLLTSIGVEIGFYLPGYALPAALGAGVVASVAAAYLPARRAVRVAPVESMRPQGVLESIDSDEKVSAGVTGVGLILLISGIGLVFWGPPRLSFMWVGMLLLGVMVSSYGLTGPITKATSLVANRAGAAGRLAASALERAPRRAWATSAAVVVATAMVVAQAGIQSNLTKSLGDVVGSLGEVDLYVSTSSGGNFGDVLLPGDWSDELSAIPGVAGVGTNIFQFISFREQKVLLQGLEGPGMAEAAPALAGASAEAQRKLDSGEGAILSVRFSELYGVEKGETLSLPTPTGLRRYEVVHVAPQFTWERGMITLGRKAIIEAFGTAGVSDYGLIYEDGADGGAIRRQVEAFTASSPREVFVFTGSDQLREIFAAANQITALFESMTFVVVGAALLAIFNALLISVVERRRELGIMRAIGTSRRQLRRMVGFEAAALGIVGGVIGALVGFLLHRASISAIAEPSGYPIYYEFIASPAAAAILIGIGIAVLGSFIPARRAASVNIIEAIGYE